MKWVYVFFLVFALGFADAHPDAVCKGQKSLIEPYLRDLEELGYCVIPSVLPTEEERALRKKAFEMGITAVGCSLKHTKDYMESEFERYLEDPSYVQPKIHLSPLGTSLLGIEP